VDHTSASIFSVVSGVVHACFGCCRQDLLQPIGRKLSRSDLRALQCLTRLVCALNGPTHGPGCTAEHRRRTRAAGNTRRAQGLGGRRLRFCLLAPARLANPARLKSVQQRGLTQLLTHRKHRRKRSRRWVGVLWTRSRPRLRCVLRFKALSFRAPCFSGLEAGQLHCRWRRSRHTAAALHAQSATSRSLRRARSEKRAARDRPSTSRLSDSRKRFSFQRAKTEQATTTPLLAR
jgi:hypothetical protein